MVIDPSLHRRKHAARLALAILAASLVACTTQKQSGVVAAAAAPLNDLNLVQTEIPEVLMAAKQDPYSVPADQGCLSLDASILAMDEVLGPDLDELALADKPGLVDRGSIAAGNAAVGALRRTAEGVVPFRSWVRKLSGAERHSRRVSAAIAVGVVRRAFLKGLRASNKCPSNQHPKNP